MFSIVNVVKLKDHECGRKFAVLLYPTITTTKSHWRVVAPPYLSAFVLLAPEDNIDIKSEGDVAFFKGFLIMLIGIINIINVSRYSFSTF
jgi:hypothetical protein